MNKIYKSFVLLVILFFFAGNSFAQETGVIYPTEFKITKPLRDLVKEHPFVEPDFNAPVKVSPDRKNRPHQTFVYSVEDGPEYGNDPSIIQKVMGKRPISQDKAVLQNFAGAPSAYYPPDPTGAVGPNHYVQMVNSTTVTIFSKTGTTIMSFQLGTLWGLSSNNGDPIVMYDKFADRWFLAQFGSSTDRKIYIAVSQTNDPTGSYYTWTYVAPDFPDYLKFSIWHDGYYMTSNQTTDKVYVFERSVMLTGGSGARGIYSTFTTGSVSAFFIPLPADAADNATLPPSGTPFPFFAYYDNAWGGGADGVKIWNMTTNWTAGSATIASAIQINTNAFDASYNSSWNDCPQPNGQYLDGIGGVLMFRAPWRSWSGYNNVVLTWGVLISNSPRQRGIYWCELRQVSGTWSVYQQGIYTPDASTYWMSSAAMDDNGSIALCYAKSSTSIYPGLYYTGRLASDPLGTMSFAETTAIAGTASQSGNINRFGDYAQTSLDPDGITFWHTGEYVTSASGQETRIYSFQLPLPAVVASVSIAVTSGSNPTCAGSSVTFTATPTNGGTTPTYQWYLNGSTISGATNSTYTSTTLANGNNITCVMTSSLSGVIGNPATSNAISMTVNPIPATPSASSNSPVCAGSAINLTTPTVSGATYSWTGPNSFTSTAQNPTIASAASANAGTYAVTVTVSGCTSPAGTTNVVVNSGPATPTASSNSPLCAGGTLMLSTPTVSGATYNWTGPNSFTSTLQNPTITNVTTANSGTYSVTISQGGCPSLAGTTTVVVNALPATPAASSNSPVCIGSTINLTTPAVSGATYSWTGPNSFTSTAQNPSITGASTAMAGTYSLKVTVSGCTSLAGTTSVVVNSLPATPVASSNSPVCIGSTINLTTPAVTGATYSWTGPNSFTSTAQNPSITGASAAMAGAYSVTVTVSGCTSLAGTTSVVVNSLPATPTAGSNSPVCAGSTINLATPIVSGATYSWTGPNSFTSTLQNPTIANATASNTGTYSVTVTQGGCTSLAGTTTVVLNSPPTAAFTGSPTSTTCSGFVQFTDNSTGAPVSWLWDFGDGQTSALQSPSHTYAASGTYTVSLTATNACGSDLFTRANYITINTIALPSGTGASRCGSGTLTLNATGTGTIEWYDAATGGNLLASGTSYTTPNISTTTTYYAEDHIPATTQSVGPTVAGNSSTSSSYLTFDVSQPMTLISVQARRQFTNNVTISLQDNTGATLQSTTVSVGTSATTITLNWTIPVGTGYRLVTPSNSRLYRMSSGVSYPYSIAGLVSITGCSAGSTIYGSYFNWQVKGPDCRSARLPLTATINPTVTPSVSVVATATTICAGTSVTFTANPVNGGTPTYQWKLNGSDISGATNATYTSTALANGNNITCVMTPTNLCVSPTTATSNTVTMTVNPVVTPSVSVTATATTICAGTSVNFTATPVNGGTPTYQWKLNGSNISGATNSTYTSTALVNGNIITCDMNSTVACASPVTANSNAINMIVNLMPLAQAGTDATYTGIPIQIGSPASGPGAFSWSPATGLSDPAISQPTAAPSATTTYTLTVNNSGCSASDAITITYGNIGHSISGKTRYAAKANAGAYGFLPTYNPVIYNIGQVIVILKNSPEGTELARDTSNALGNYQFTGVNDGTYLLSYDKYTADTMQSGDGVNAIDVALMKYYITSDSLYDPSRWFSEIYRKAANVDNNASVNSIDVSRIKSKIGSPTISSRNFPKGNWVALNKTITVAGSDVTTDLETICYGDYNASSIKFQDSTSTWNAGKSLPENFIHQSGESITTSNSKYFEVPLRISTKINDFAALSLELSYPNSQYKLVSASMPKTSSKDGVFKINPTLEEIITADNDLLVTDAGGIIRVVFATTDHFDVAPNDELISLGFSPVNTLKQGEVEFKLSGTGVIGNQFGEENDDVFLMIPKIFVQGDNTDAGFEFTGYPNPFSDDATLTYSIPEKGSVKLKVFNAIGELVTELVNEKQESGKHSIVFSQKNLPEGMYTFKLEYTGLNKTKSLILKMVH